MGIKHFSIIDLASKEIHATKFQVKTVLLKIKYLQRLFALGIFLRHLMIDVKSTKAAHNHHDKEEDHLESDFSLLFNSKSGLFSTEYVLGRSFSKGGDLFNFTFNSLANNFV